MQIPVKLSCNFTDLITLYMLTLAWDTLTRYLTQAVFWRYASNDGDIGNIVAWPLSKFATDAYPLRAVSGQRVIVHHPT